MFFLIRYYKPTAYIIEIDIKLLSFDLFIIISCE